MPAKGKEGWLAPREDQRRAALRPSRLGGQGDRAEAQGNKPIAFEVFGRCDSQIEADNPRTECEHLV